MVKIIVAYDLNKVIGNKGQLPWSFPDDLAHFKRTTSGHVVVMGNTTYESLKMAALPRRDNVVITHKQKERWAEFKAKYPDSITGPMFAGSLDEAIRHCKFIHPTKDIFIIGGASVYKLALESGIVDEIIVSQINSTYDGDTYFPKISKDNKCFFKESNIQPMNGFDIITYKKSILPCEV